MGDKSTLNKAFNKHLFEFLEDVMKIYPENDEIRSANTALTTLKKMNPTIVIKTWYSMLYVPYANEIDSGNIDFFFEKDYREDLAKFGSSGGTGEIINVIEKIRGPIKSMNDKNKAHCAQYLINLSKLSLMYSQK